jgi:hypothetical protein
VAIRWPHPFQALSCLVSCTPSKNETPLLARNKSSSDTWFPIPPDLSDTQSLPFPCTTQRMSQGLAGCRGLNRYGNSSAWHPSFFLNPSLLTTSFYGLFSSRKSRVRSATTTKKSRLDRIVCAVSRSLGSARFEGCPLFPEDWRRRWTTWCTSRPEVKLSATRLSRGSSVSCTCLTRSRLGLGGLSWNKKLTEN